MACLYCYARRMYNRFKWDKTIRFDVNELLAIEKLKKPSGIFLGSTFELFWDGLERFWLDSIFATIKVSPQHRFYLLTKQPQNLINFSPFPNNCWVGVTATDAKSFLEAGRGLEQIEAKVKYISLEPLLDHIGGLWAEIWFRFCINWVIIGLQTPYNPKTAPKMEWIEEIVKACNKAGVPVFLKNNLRPWLTLCGVTKAQRDAVYLETGLRQEMPK